MTSTKEKLYIIDGMAQIYRAHFAMINNPLTTNDGRHTSVIYGFLNILFKIIKEEKPDYLAIAMDSKSKTFRHKLYDDYKANRKKMPEEISYQIPILKEIINFLGIKMIECPGYEADDIMGTVCKIAETKNLESYIVSGDKDMLQMVNDNIIVYSPTPPAPTHPSQLPLLLRAKKYTFHHLLLLLLLTTVRLHDRVPDGFNLLVPTFLEL